MYYDIHFFIVFGQFGILKSLTSQIAPFSQIAATFSNRWPFSQIAGHFLKSLKNKEIQAIAQIAPFSQIGGIFSNRSKQGNTSNCSNRAIFSNRCHFLKSLKTRSWEILHRVQTSHPASSAVGLWP